MFKFIQNLSRSKITEKEEKDYTEEGAEEKKELLKITMKDDDLIKEIDKDIQSAEPLYNQMKGIQDENEKYYLGEQLDASRFSWELPSAENLLYMGTETIISILTSRRKEPIVIPTRNNDESKELARRSQQFLAWKWHDEDMSIKYEDWIRQAKIARIGVLKVRFDIEKDDFEILHLRPQRIMIDKEATNEYNAKFLVEFKEDILGDLIELYPGAANKLKEEFGSELGTPIKYIEYWTNEFVVWKVNNIVLAKKKNPNWNWDEKDRQKNLKKLKKRWTEKTKNEKLKNILLNYFNEPRKPYIILSLKSLGKDIYADTSDFEQGKRVQDIINRRERQIDKAATKALGREVISGSFIGKAEAKKTVANPNAPLWIEKGRVGDAITHVAPQPVSPVLFESLKDKKLALDNVMGVHGTTRGEQGPHETATGRTILREGDFGRIDLMGRRIDKKLELLYAWMFQMVKVYYNESHYIKLLGQEGATDYLQYSGDDIEDGQEIIVKSELTVDKATQRENAVKRLEMGLSDPISMLEDLDVPNPKERARRMVIYNIDPKLYIAQFCSDENAEGAENTPQGRAVQEQQRIMEGEEVPPFKGVDQSHIQEHDKFIKSNEFKNSEDVEMKQNMINHLRGELDILRSQTKV